ncbi:MAG TPA: hypothetical protein VD970_10680 [Acetobacteraceae bacterium]|nr:hypothetical protein [Acetobacteraceae bacterium]
MASVAGLSGDIAGFTTALRAAWTVGPTPAAPAPPVQQAVVFPASPPMGDFSGFFSFRGFNTGTGLDLNAFRQLDFGDLNSLAVFASRLPLRFARPDATGEVRTGGSDIGREEAETAAILSAAPRIVEAFGPDAVAIELRGEIYDVVRRYDDPVSGFYAVQLHPRDGGAEIFAIDGLEVGSRADQVASATLARLQVQSAAFRAMVADADSYAISTRGEVLVTGASLGGAVAEVAAYEIAEGLVATRLPFTTGVVQLVTVDALGGRDAAEAINGGRLLPAPLRLIEALNLRDEGDIVSRIGSHIGATVTFPTYDENGRRVVLDAEDAHVNVVSLLQVLESDALFAQGVRGAPAEISGFAAASKAVSPALIAAYLASGERDPTTPTKLQIPGEASFDATRTIYSLDADSDGDTDLSVFLARPAPPSLDPFVL